MALPPFWTLKREGCCSRFSPLLTPVQKETAGRPSGLHSPDFVFLPHVDLRKSGGTSLLLRLIMNISKCLVSPKLSLTVQCSHKNRTKGPISAVIALPGDYSLQPVKMVLWSAPLLCPPQHCRFFSSCSTVVKQNITKFAAAEMLCHLVESSYLLYQLLQLSFIQLHFFHLYIFCF